MTSLCNPRTIIFKESASVIHFRRTKTSHLRLTLTPKSTRVKRKGQRHPHHPSHLLTTPSDPPPRRDPCPSTWMTCTPRCRRVLRRGRSARTPCCRRWAPAPSSVVRRPWGRRGSGRPRGTRPSMKPQEDLRFGFDRRDAKPALSWFNRNPLKQVETLSGSSTISNET